jgi:zinc protease
VNARTLALAAAVLLAAAASAPASAASTTLPAYTKTRLDNGLTVIVMPTKRLPLVDFRLVADAGSVCDPAGKEGLSRLTAELLTQGAGGRGAQQIAGDIEFVGGSLDAGAGSEQMTVSCEVLSKDLALGLELFRDVIVSPTFAAEEFDRKKQEALGEIESAKNEPQAIADRALASYLYGEHPLGHPALGHASSVGAIGRDDVVAFHRRHVTPDRSILAVVGDVEPKALIAQLRRAFAGWKPAGGATPAVDYGPAPPVTGRTIRIIQKPEATQTQIRLACPSVPRGHPDYFAIQVANTILGDGFTSRLVNSIRVDQGLTYSIGSRFLQHRMAGAFRIGTFTRNDQLRRCVDAVLAEVQKLVDEGPTPAELDKSRNYLVGQYPIGLQAPDDLAAELVNVEFYRLDPGFIETYGERVRAVTMDDVKRVLKQHFCTKDLRLLVVSNPDVARKALDGLGTIDEKPIE